MAGLIRPWSRPQTGDDLALLAMPRAANLIAPLLVVEGDPVEPARLRDAGGRSAERLARAHLPGSW